MDKHNLPDDQLEKMEGCLKFCQDLGHQIQSLLDINKMEEGKLVPQREVTHLPELIDGLLEQFKPVAEQRKISLFFSPWEKIPSISIDRSLMQRVIANLLNNAIRHSPQGGTIQMAVNLVPEKGGLCISVKDNGDGLAPEYHQKIFDKFEQVKLKSEEGRVGSSGLGLNFCKMAVEAHGGKIWVESEGEGRGCTFRSLLPVCPQ
jgi:signal transduction histidine kinase